MNSLLQQALRRRRNRVMSSGGGGALPTPLLTGLRAYWDLTADESDAHENALDLTNTNAVTFDADGAHFVAASSQKLARADEVLVSIGAGQSFTISAWFNPATLGPAARPVIMKDGGGANREYGIYVTAGGVVRIMLFDTSGGAAIEKDAPTVVVSTGNLYFVTAGYDAGTSEAFIQVNDAAEGRGSFADGVRDAGAALEIGHQTGVYWDGIIRNVGLWGRLLTADEHTFLRNSGTPRPYSEVAAYVG
jgi:hypothetical protein